MELKTLTLPMENPEVWESSKTFKEYVRQFVPNLSSVVQIARPWVEQQPPEKRQKYWVLYREVFRENRPITRKMMENTMKMGKVIVSVAIR